MDPGREVTDVFRTVIKTPSRRREETDADWNTRRFDVFAKGLMAILSEHQPELLLTEVTTHAFAMSGGRRSTKGIEYRAGYGLGRSRGWLDGVLLLASQLCIAPQEVVEISSARAKLRTTGNAGATKTSVRGWLEDTWRTSLKDWQEAEVDALAVATAYLREQGQDPWTSHRVRQNA